MKNMLMFKYMVAVFISAIVLSGISAPQAVRAEAEAPEDAPLVKIEGLKGCRKDKALYGVKRTIKVVVTAYSSAWDETTGIPGKPGLITASGKPVADGVAAYNHLPFGTKFRIDSPEFEGQTFVVEDRTAQGRRNVDLWKGSKHEAINFGVKRVNIEILEG